MRDRHKYPAEWHDLIRPDILKRDKYKCQQCGIRHRQWIVKDKNNNITKIEKDEITDYSKATYKIYQIILHVCHKDNNKDNCNYNNLICKCVSCHAKMDAGFKAILRKSNRVKNQLTIYDIINKATILDTQADRVADV